MAMINALKGILLSKEESLVAAFYAEKHQLEILHMNALCQLAATIPEEEWGWETWKAVIMMRPDYDQVIVPKKYYNRQEVRECVMRPSYRTGQGYILPDGIYFDSSEEKVFCRITVDQ